MQLILMHGLPGSGKSSKAQEIISANPNSILLSADDNLSSVNDVYLFSPATVKLAHELLLQQLRVAFQRDVDYIVVDNTNLNWKNVGDKISEALKHGIPFSLVEPDTEWRYDVQRCYELNTHNVPLEVIRRMQNSREPVEKILAQAQSANLIINGGAK